MITDMLPFRVTEHQSIGYTMIDYKRITVRVLMAANDYQLWLASWSLIREQLEDQLAPLGRKEIATFLDDLDAQLADIARLTCVATDQLIKAECDQCQQPLSLADLAQGVQRCRVCAKAKKRAISAISLTA